MNRIIRAVATARLVPARDWLRPRRIALVRKVARHTLLPHARLSHLADLATGLPTGAVVECGSYEGGSGAVLAVASGRPTWLFDSWEGCPEPEPHDVDRHGIAAEAGQFAASHDRARQLIDTLWLDGQVRLVRGWFEDTLPATKVDIGPIALLHIDADWYDSVRTCLEELAGQIVPGGVVVVDDYGEWQGARKATDEWLDGRGIDLHRFDDSQAWFVNP
jgi:O-methyltransferase